MTLNITGPTGVYAVVETENGTNTLHYVLKDNLGSWTAITDSTGMVEQRLSYDAWGNLRDPATWSGSFTGMHRAPGRMTSSLALVTADAIGRTRAIQKTRASHGTSTSFLIIS